MISNQCLKTHNLSNEKILIFGGSGSLGTNTIKRWINDNKIVNISRNEEKQWKLKTFINNLNLDQIIGDISIQYDVDNCILKTDPTIICIFACLKHIDVCEKNTNKSFSINTNGIMNVYNTLLKYKTNVKTVLYVSTDKACKPITTYGFTKALSEAFLQQIIDSKIKWVCVRYGNVLNSSGSIIPYLNSLKHTDLDLKITDINMTRFIMTLEQSINLIEYAIFNGLNGEIIVPKLLSMSIHDLFKIYSNNYNKKIVISGLRCKEKIHEDLLSDIESTMTYENGCYYHITNDFKNSNIKSMSSSMNLLTKDQLEKYLNESNLIL